MSSPVFLENEVNTAVLKKILSKSHDVGFLIKPYWAELKRILKTASPLLNLKMN